MKKNIFLTSLFIILVSIYNVLYKYIIVKENTLNYSNSFGSSFITTSSVKPPYLQIFLTSLLCLIIIVFLLIITLYFINKKEITKTIIFNKLSKLVPLIVSLIVSLFLLFINKIFSYIVIVIGLMAYLFFMNKEFNKKSNIIIIIFILIMIYLLYLISS